MPNRRTFLRAATLAAAAACYTSACAQESPTAAPLDYSAAIHRLNKGSRFVFQGDSITDMKWGRNEADRNHYLGHSYVYLIAARLGVDLPAAKFEFFNRGHSGNTVRDLRDRWQADAVDLKPDILSILIGVNDVGQMVRAQQDHVPLEKWEADYRAILDASRQANPQLQIVLLDPFMLPSKRFSHEEYQKRRGETDKLRTIVSRLAADFKATHILTQQIFDDAIKLAEPEHWMWDSVHPLPQGHELIARNWLQNFGSIA